MRASCGILPRLLLGVACLLAASPAWAQTYTPDKPRRQFMTVSYSWIYTEPLHFAEHPLEDLVGREVAAAQFEAYEYRTRDETILIDVVEFKKRGQGAAVTVYPLGASVGPALAVRGSYEQLPAMQVDFAGAGAPAPYRLRDGRAYDIGAGVYMSDRSSGWGLGSHAFVVAGVGRLDTSLGDGTRRFAEGGGGLNVGPFGVELSVKFAWNRLKQPVEHRFLTIPVSLRGTVSF
jgi:hypothetical protein